MDLAFDNSSYNFDWLSVRLLCLCDNFSNRSSISLAKTLPMARPGVLWSWAGNQSGQKHSLNGSAKQHLSSIDDKKSYSSASQFLRRHGDRGSIGVIAILGRRKATRYQSEIETSLALRAPILGSAGDRAGHVKDPCHTHSLEPDGVFGSCSAREACIQWR